MLVDDVDFITEVRQGVAEAPDMNPNYELTKLKKKFEIWKREFKDKLKTTEDVLKKLDKLGGEGGAARASASAVVTRTTPAAATSPTTATAAKRMGGVLGGMFKH